MEERDVERPISPRTKGGDHILVLSASRRNRDLSNKKGHAPGGSVPFSSNQSENVSLTYNVVSVSVCG